jgi:MFS family permease
MRWGRKADETIASNEVVDDERHENDERHEPGAHVDTTRIDEADRYPADDDDGVDRRSVIGREKEALGGVKVGSAFFGWLTATGMAVLLTALVAAGGAAVSLAQGDEADAPNVETIGAVEAAVLLVIFFVAYYCGGYVAGRMARFNGLRQGIAVWIWAVVIAVVVAIVAALAGDQYDIQSELNNFPRIPSNEGDVTTNGVIAALAIAAVTLVGAIMGGLAGMRFHRKVDRAGLGS